MQVDILKRAVERFAAMRVAVVGDLMLDSYTWGSARRISPEAPVPVVTAERENSCLGGAGNVMRNIVTLGGGASAYGVLGDDADANLVRGMLENYGVSHDMVLADKTRKTTRKQRILVGSQQLLRIDFEDTCDLIDELREQIAAPLVAAIRGGKVDAVLFEDYGKGVLSGKLVKEVVDAANACGVITALDPKPGNFSPVKGITVMKPNRGEAYAMSGIAEERAGAVGLEQVAEHIRNDWGVEQLLISLAAQGLALFRPGLKPVYIPTRAREVFDVSGAGDTLISTYTLAIASGSDPEVAAAVANIAAGVVVGKIGTVTVTKEELLKAIEDGGE